MIHARGVAIGNRATRQPVNQSVTTHDSRPGPWTHLMRRAGRVLEGGESFDSSGSSLAGHEGSGRVAKCDVELAG